MDEKTSGSNVSIEPKDSISTNEKAAAVPSSTTSSERASSEQRQAYGTAKTENLRDSGLWRIFLPAAVVIFCLTLLVIPLVILIPLLNTSINALLTGDAKEAQLLWVWITMIVLEVGVCFVIIRGLLKIFVTQAGNYQS